MSVITRTADSSFDLNASWTVSDVKRIQLLEEAGGIVSRVTAASVVLTLPAKCLADFGRQFFFAVVTLPMAIVKSLSRLVGMPRLFPHIDSLEKTILHMLRALAYLSAAIAVTVTIPFAITFPHTVSAWICDTLHLCDAWVVLPEPVNERDIENPLPPIMKPMIKAGTVLTQPKVWPQRLASVVLFPGRVGLGVARKVGQLDDKLTEMFPEAMFRIKMLVGMAGLVGAGVGGVIAKRFIDRYRYALPDPDKIPCEPICLPHESPMVTNASGYPILAQIKWKVHESVYDRSLPSPNSSLALVDRNVRLVGLVRQNFANYTPPVVPDYVGDNISFFVAGIAVAIIALFAIVQCVKSYCHREDSTTSASSHPSTPLPLPSSSPSTSSPANTVLALQSATTTTPTIAGVALQLYQDLQAAASDMAVVEKTNEELSRALDQARQELQQSQDQRSSQDQHIQQLTQEQMELKWQLDFATTPIDFSMWPTSQILAYLTPIVGNEFIKAKSKLVMRLWIEEVFPWAIYLVLSDLINRTTPITKKQLVDMSHLAFDQVLDRYKGSKPDSWSCLNGTSDSFTALMGKFVRLFNNSPITGLGMRQAGVELEDKRSELITLIWEFRERLLQAAQQQPLQSGPLMLSPAGPPLGLIGSPASTTPPSTPLLLMPPTTNS